MTTTDDIARRRLPVLQRGSLRSDGSRAFPYPADVTGRFHTARTITFVVLIAIYVLLPFVQIGGHPAVFLDVPRRSFHLFGASFNAQDLWLCVFLLLGAGLALLLFTAVLGRVWCGWACPQTVFLDGVYRRIERWVEGPRSARMKRDQGGWDWDKTWRKLVKHGGFALVSLGLAHVFLAYFVSVGGLYTMMGQAPSSHPEAFAIVAVTSIALYLNFARFREQLCLGVCPYGRLQSVLVDEDSLVVGYDARRGEPRGKTTVEHAGDCVDCKRCVVVCPTGIDIREGYQIDCIGCTACIDACDEIMTKLDRPRGLIRYESQRALDGGTHRLLRPRVILYAALLAVAIVGGALAGRSHTPFEADLLRDPGPPYIVDGDQVRDQFELHLVNKRSTTTHFEVAAEPVAGGQVIIPLAHVAVEPDGVVDAPIIVTIPRAAFHGDFRLVLRVHDDDGGEEREVEGRVLGPE